MIEKFPFDPMEAGVSPLPLLNILTQGGGDEEDPIQ